MMRAEHDARAAFAALELGPGASRQAVVRAYRRLAKRTHPDTSSARDAADRFVHLAEAYEQALAATSDQTSAAPRLASAAGGALVPAPPHQEQWIVAGPVTVRRRLDPPAVRGIVAAGPVLVVRRPEGGRRWT